MVKRGCFLKVKFEDAICFIAHVPETSLNWIGSPPLIPGYAGNMSEYVQV